MLDLTPFDVPITELDLQDIVLIEENQSVKNALGKMIEKDVSALVVMNDGVFCGLLTETDLIVKKDFSSVSLDDVFVRDIMVENVSSISGKLTVRECLEIFRNNHFSLLLIGENGEAPQKILTTEEIINYIFKIYTKEIEIASTSLWLTENNEVVFDQNFKGDNMKGDRSDYSNVFCHSVTRILLAKPIRIDCNTSARDALIILKENKVSSAVVVEYDTLLRGLITRRDIVQKVLIDFSCNKDIPISNFMNKDAEFLQREYLVGHAIKQISLGKVRDLVVVSGDNFPIGTISILELIRFMAGSLFE